MNRMDPMANSCPPRIKISLPGLGSALALLWLAGLTPAWLSAQTAGPQQTEPAKPDTVKPAAADTMKVETFVERAERRGTAVRLSLKDAMKMALQNNLSIAIQDYSEEILKSRIFATAHVYEPRLVTGFGWRSDTNPNTTFFSRSETSDSSTSRRLTWFGRLIQPLPYGGNYSLDYGNSRSTRLPPTNNDLFSSNFGGSLLFSFTQPLLKDFRENNNFRALKLIKLDDKINDSRFEEMVTDVLKRVQDVYWDLVYAIQNQNILKKSLDLARVQLDNNKRKVEIGILAPIAITEASAEEATRVQALISSENQINNMENNLKRSLSNDRTSPIWNQDIIPTETAEPIQVQLDMDEALTTALAKRPELRRSQLELEKNEVDYQFYKNQKKPRVDFTGSIGTVGQAGTATARGLSLLPPTFIGGMGSVNSQLFSAPYRNYNVGITIDIPLRNRPLEETMAQLSLQRRQTSKQLKDAEQLVVVDVRNALQAIQTNRQVVESAKVGFKLAQEQNDAEAKRFAAGLSDTFRVLTRQRDQADAEGRLLLAQINYRKSLNDLQRAKFTTIDQSDMEVARSQVPAGER